MKLGYELGKGSALTSSKSLKAPFLQTFMKNKLFTFALEHSPK